MFCSRSVAFVPRLLRSVHPLRLRRLLAALHDLCNRSVAFVPRLLRSVHPLRLRRLLAALPSLLRPGGGYFGDVISGSLLPADQGRQAKTAVFSHLQRAS